MKLLFQACLAAAVFFANTVARAAGGVSVAEMLLHQYAGSTEGSLAGSYGYALALSSESGQSVIRLGMGIKGGVTQGIITYSDTEYDVSVIQGGASAGLSIHPFRSTFLQPFVGASGLVGWNLFRSAAPPSSEDENVHRLDMGYELIAGADIALQANLVRIATRFVSTSTTYAGKAL
jgi:hypothetical protein